MSEEKTYLAKYIGKTVRGKYQHGLRFRIIIRQNEPGVIGVCYAFERKNLVLYANLHEFLANWSKIEIPLI